MSSSSEAKKIFTHFSGLGCKDCRKEAVGAAKNGNGHTWLFCGEHVPENGWCLSGHGDWSTRFTHNKVVYQQQRVGPFEITFLSSNNNHNPLHNSHNITWLSPMINHYTRENLYGDSGVHFALPVSLVKASTRPPTQAQLDQVEIRKNLIKSFETKSDITDDDLLSIRPVLGKGIAGFENVTGGAFILVLIHENGLVTINKDFWLITADLLMSNEVLRRACITAQVNDPNQLSSKLWELVNSKNLRRVVPLNEPYLSDMILGNSNSSFENNLNNNCICIFCQKNKSNHHICNKDEDNIKGCCHICLSKFVGVISYKWSDFNGAKSITCQCGFQSSGGGLDKTLLPFGWWWVDHYANPAGGSIVAIQNSWRVYIAAKNRAFLLPADCEQDMTKYFENLVRPGCDRFWLEIESLYRPEFDVAVPGKIIEYNYSSKCTRLCEKECSDSFLNNKIMTWGFWADLWFKDRNIVLNLKKGEDVNFIIPELVFDRAHKLLYGTKTNNVDGLKWLKGIKIKPEINPDREKWLLVDNKHFKPDAIQKTDHKNIFVWTIYLYWPLTVGGLWLLVNHDHDKKIVEILESKEISKAYFVSDEKDSEKEKRMKMEKRLREDYIQFGNKLYKVSPTNDTIEFRKLLDEKFAYL
eukprot:c21581_g1_i1.p1 GENE.c21581_g1_i1~~c21581_g1_i1.p1  ORF type:complete len:714 (+),score=234.24 c21581_g1_i1:227-2143(+)